MFQLKNYQQTTLTVLQAYLEAARVTGPAAAYRAIMQNNVGPNFKPYQTLNGLVEVPYICLRLPTGGGKTLLAAHTTAIAAHAYLEQDYPLVLWLVPTNTIRLQTLETLKTPEHPNRQVLDDAFGGRLLVLDISDFAQIRPQDLRDKAIMVVGTLATLRVDNTEGRKVYAHNENLEPHFSRVPDNTPGLERLEAGPDKGKIKFSFRNLLALSRPLVLVDEAHNASTSLSFEVMQRINPAGVIEFTATPADNSNILHNVSAAELKAEEMIKLPIILTEHQTWQAALRDSILTRQKLHDLARHEPDFIRPIVLIQAENKDKEVTVEVVENYLVEQEKINRERIAIATGNQRELDGVNLLDPANKVEFVITVQALKEGWDCPFAYVFCSVATVHSASAVEQLLGRVLRMPYAKMRRQPDLNKAYAHVSSASWPQAVGKLHDHLVSMGFDRQEAGQFIQPQPPLFGLPKQVGPSATVKLTLSDAPDLSGLNMFELHQVAVAQTETGVIELEITGPISAELEQKLVKAAPRQDRSDVEKTLAVHRQHQRPLSPAEKGETFIIPQLCLWVDGELEPAEQEFFLDVKGWNLLYCPAQLSEIEFAVKEETTSYSVDIQGERLVEKFLGSQLALDLNDVQTEWTELQLSRWFDARLRQPDVKQEVLLEFCRRVVDFLIKSRKISLATLVRTRYPLEKILRQKIKTCREQAYKNGYQATLFGAIAAVETSYEYGFSFDPNNYPAHWHYDGSYQFNKHFYPLVGELETKGEEFECAQAIDRTYPVKYWVRNLAKQPEFSFKLPIATGHFYPDFVLKLRDDRILVVEYKGSHLVGGPDTEEKQNIGELWAEKSNGRGLFLMAVKQDEWGRDVYQQLEHKISGE